ncbi:MAG: hypothetical protein U0794_06450 [Isosphaeraceae bacterium]
MNQLSMDLVRVTEGGRHRRLRLDRTGEKEEADRAATEAMRDRLNASTSPPAS